MPKPTKIPGLNDYGDDDTSAPGTKQTVFPKAQGGQAPPSSPGKETGIPGLKDYGDDKLGISLSAQPDPQGDGTWSSLLHDVFHPQAANLDRPQTWHDWLTRTYSPAASDVGTAALDDASLGFADPIRARMTGENLADLRARTADAQAAMGPAGPLVNALTYAAPGGLARKGLEAAELGGKVAAKLGRYGAAALEGGTASGTSSIGHQAGDPNGIDALKVAKDAGTGAVFGVGGQAVGDAAASAVRNISNYVRGSPGRSGEQWNWRKLAATNDLTAGGVANQQNSLAANDPAQPGLAKVQSALAQSTDPGNVAHAVTGLGGWGAAKLAGGDEMAQWALGIGGPFASKYFVNPVAGSLNKIDRNINVGQALDQLYPALYGPQKAPALDTSGWADWIRQGAIGSERPGPPGSQIW